ncbi:ferrous iron transport protein B [Sediminispirochaeta smaragdinae]|uniref:Ferrous iron transport protein B n=1 Tax=Sediminispirochaeta smaragdinae (strain DSM 11293 / JCM 15392 / SEBR 4228) TaxID=573413 RepID=E1R8H7_SEDSS|nr:ferrous iron transport protein B [Sediminispirochaeta smaragdinae]ADK79321.1 ferrous iron transport protein B [Sediminispirochaeta smaragdinae DSM 11293]
MGSFRFALTGNPNSGKTSIFNAATGANQKVGNWGGVTVDVKEGNIRRGNDRVTLIDIPGTYSLSAYTMEELVAREVIIKGDADVIINVLDSTNLERNLYLGVQVMEMGRPMVLAFNMSDELKRSGTVIDTEALSRLFGIPIRFTVGRNGEGVRELLDEAIRVAKGEHPATRQVSVNYGKEIEAAIESLAELVEKSSFNLRGISPRWYALKLLERDDEILRKVRERVPADSPDDNVIFKELESRSKEIEQLYGEDAATIISERRYGFIIGALNETVNKPKANRINISEKIDDVLTNRFLAYPIFAFFMWILFQTTFGLGAYPMAWIESGITALGNWIGTTMPPGAIRDLLTDGVIAGVGGVLVFLPNILILFLGISILEDTGYMARIAFIMDKVMHRIGLHGKSFIPLVMGVGCSVPAIMAARTLESKKDRILTILIAPLITCSARLPVYILFTGAFFPNIAGNVIFILYFLSFLFAFGMGWLFRKTLFRGEEYPFVMELPPYRIPTFRSALIHMWEKAKHYLQKMGGVVLIFSIIIWFLGNYPKQPEMEKQYDTMIAEQREQGHQEEVQALQRELKRKQVMQSYIGKAGTFIEPVLAPLGFDWRMDVSLMTGFVAKEVVVSTLGVLFTAGNEEGKEESGTELRDALRDAYSPLVGFAFLIFVMLYTPCIVAFVTLVKEVGSWKWSIFSLGYQLTLAWIAAFIVYRGGIILGLG